ncbi:hypothetical protein RR42_s3188 [Cupriavidus basilensis]|uniref:Uncharacterized protein n=1 Tax=Cupriavidus basilensis TaxID=68895 RepID=A0A0C4YS62_9BURK|nr:hypothetical protein RR42_s3188 [Cupriavidus basilensis]
MAAVGNECKQVSFALSSKKFGKICKVMRKIRKDASSLPSRRDLCACSPDSRYRLATCAVTYSN